MMATTGVVIRNSFVEIEDEDVGPPMPRRCRAFSDVTDLKVKEPLKIQLANINPDMGHCAGGLTAHGDGSTGSGSPLSSADGSTPRRPALMRVEQEEFFELKPRRASANMPTPPDARRMSSDLSRASVGELGAPARSRRCRLFTEDGFDDHYFVEPPRGRRAHTSMGGEADFEDELPDDLGQPLAWQRFDTMDWYDDKHDLLDPSAVPEALQRPCDTGPYSGHAGYPPAPPWVYYPHGGGGPSPMAPPGAPPYMFAPGMPYAGPPAPYWAYPPPRHNGRGNKRGKKAAGEKQAKPKAKPKPQPEKPSAPKKAPEHELPPIDPELLAKPTTVILRNIPHRYSSSDVLELLGANGFHARFNYLYLPMDFAEGINLAYAFVNFVTHEDAEHFTELFHGYSKWLDEEHLKTGDVSWAMPIQGLEAHIARYRNSPVMHPTMPDDYKPMLFDEHGVRMPFPEPTKPLKSPKTRAAAPVPIHEVEDLSIDA